MASGPPSSGEPVGLRYAVDAATAAAIAAHLRRCDADFVPHLSQRLEIDGYAAKIRAKAATFETWSGDDLVGLVAVYLNDPGGENGFVTSVSVEAGFQGSGIADALMHNCLDVARDRGFRRIGLEVHASNARAVALYRRHGFEASGSEGELLRMTLGLEKGRRDVSHDRDYDQEAKDSAERKYAYHFDFDVMHPYMIRSFQPHFVPGKLLELGSFRGDFTERLLAHFGDVTCVEASAEAIAEAKQRLGGRVTFVNGRFEDVQLPARYENIVLTHVLEHLDDPVGILRRVGEEWLTDTGRLFLVCPNANAPSRQIAVKMGLISHNAAVTRAEAEHGHRSTYALDTLERDAVAAGLRVIARSGIFFKALANFQWDRLLETDIVSKEYLDGCYALGQQYPDLCSSIFLLCERGDRARTTPG